MSALDDLKAPLAEVFDLQRIALLLTWDQDVNMPRGGVEDRAAALAVAMRLAHEKFVSDETGRLLEAAEREVQGADYDSDEASLVRVTRRDRDQELKIPTRLVERIASEEVTSTAVWQEARAKSDWSLFEPRMDVTVELTRQLVEAVGYRDEPYDALLDLEEPGITTKQVETLFAKLREALVPLVRDLVDHSDAVDDSVLDRPLDEKKQLAFSLDVVKRLGYSTEHGRLDLSPHPFTAAVGQGDVRITTRVKRNVRDSCLFSSIHEAGHAMYYQGVPASLGRTPIWNAASNGFNESQSRLWENQVGRSPAFWKHFFPLMREVFPEELRDQDPERYFRAQSKVTPSYIRVDADEVTYNLHILLRFELERDLLDGRLAVKDIPEAWNAKINELLGLDAPPVSQGCLQDIHWSYPVMGTFVSYTLGNVIAAQLMEKVNRDIPDLQTRFENGDFGALLEWLHRNVHAHGRKFTPNELLARVTGRELDVEPLTRYLREKYSTVYGVAATA